MRRLCDGCPSTTCLGTRDPSIFQGFGVFHQILFILSENHSLWRTLQRILGVRCGRVQFTTPTHLWPEQSRGIYSNFWAVRKISIPPAKKGEGTPRYWGTHSQPYLAENRSVSLGCHQSLHIHGNEVSEKRVRYRERSLWGQGKGEGITALSYFSCSWS